MKTGLWNARPAPSSKTHLALLKLLGWQWVNRPLPDPFALSRALNTIITKNFLQPAEKKYVNVCRLRAYASCNQPTTRRNCLEHHRRCSEMASDSYALDREFTHPRRGNFALMDLNFGDCGGWTKKNDYLWTQELFRRMRRDNFFLQLSN